MGGSDGEGEGGREEEAEEEEVFGSGLANQLRQLKAATSAARSAMRGGSSGGGGGAEESRGSSACEEVRQRQASAKRSFAALSAASGAVGLLGSDGGLEEEREELCLGAERERLGKAGPGKRQARTANRFSGTANRFSIDVGRGCCAPPKRERETGRERETERD